MIPATTANLGPGFDCLGLALTLYNRVAFIESTGNTWPTVTVEGEGAAVIPADRENLVLRAADQVFTHLGIEPAPFDLHQRNEIPVGSGLGSSAAAVVGGMLAANGWVGDPLSREEILRLATEMEGHPDNVAPALFGGLTLVVSDEAGIHAEPITIPQLPVVTVLPEFDLPTARARAALPDEVPLGDAVFNASHLALLLHGLAEGDHEKIARGMQDRLHQPYRLPLIPGMAAAFAAARRAGASGVAISGAGPALAAFAPQKHESITAAVADAFAEVGLASRSWILEVDRQGSTIRNQLPPR